MKSNDWPVGNCYNFAQYSLLLHMLAQVVDMEPYEFIHSAGDVHYYQNQAELVEEQLKRKPLAPPKIWLNPEIKDLFQFKMSDIEIIGYQHLDPINYPVSV